MRKQQLSKQIRTNRTKLCQIGVQISPYSPKARQKVTVRDSFYSQNLYLLLY
jgi:hypothetical protein